MNRYVVSGLVAEAASGKRVICLSHNQTIAREAFYQAESSLNHEPKKILRTNGKERIEFDTGWIRFLSHRASLRGISADLVFIDWDAEPALASSMYADVWPVIAASPNGEVVRA